MTPNCDYDIPIRLHPIFHCDAAAGLPVAPNELGGLVNAGRLLPIFTDAGVPAIECRLHFSPGAAGFDGLAVAGMVLGFVTALSDAEMALGGTGLVLRENRVSETESTLTLRLAAVSAVGAADRLRALADAAGENDQLVARLKSTCPAVTRFEIAA